MIMKNQISEFIRRRWVQRSAMVFWIVYLSTYLALTLNGGYYGPYVSGRTRLKDSGWALRDCYIWEPLHTRLDRYGMNWSGAIFSPMILLDRLVWHRDKHIWP